MPTSNEPLIKAGDVVKTKAGGPAMTVEQISPDGYIRCVWFSKDNALCRDTFRPAALVVQ